MNRRKRIALATLPAIALLVLGTSVASAHMNRMANLTDKQRSAIDEARTLRKEGDAEGAKEVLKDAGLDPSLKGSGIFKRHGLGHTPEGRARHEAVHNALKNNDFEAFKTATAAAPFVADISEAEFAILVRAHELKESGDFEAARGLLQDADLHPWRHHGMGRDGGERKAE